MNKYTKQNNPLGYSSLVTLDQIHVAILLASFLTLSIIKTLKLQKLKVSYENPFSSSGPLFLHLQN